MTRTLDESENAFASNVKLIHEESRRTRYDITLTKIMIIHLKSILIKLKY